MASAQKGPHRREAKLEAGGRGAGEPGQCDDGKQDPGRRKLAAGQDVGAGGKRHHGRGDHGRTEAMERRPGGVFAHEVLPGD